MAEGQGRPRLVLLNAPPRSGKSSIARTLALNQPTIYIRQLKRPLISIACTLSGQSPGQYETIKDQLDPTLGVTLRHAMIQISESYIKPTYGQSFWARLLERTLPSTGGTVIIDDLGFQAELDYLGPRYTHTILHIHRPNTSWAGDSRSWIGALTAHHIENSGPLPAVVTHIRQLLESPSTWTSPTP